LTCSSHVLRRELTEVATRLTLEESAKTGRLTLEQFFERARQRGPVVLDEDPVETIRELRGPLP
jgi:hypothetical protein